MSGYTPLILSNAFLMPYTSGNRSRQNDERVLYHASVLFQYKLDKSVVETEGERTCNLTAQLSRKFKNRAGRNQNTLFVNMEMVVKVIEDTALSCTDTSFNFKGKSLLLTRVIKSRNYGISNTRGKFGILILN